MSENETHVLLEVDGEADGRHVTPDALDPVRFFSMSSRYFGLLVATARHNGNGLQFRGARVIEKCAAVRSLPSNLDVAAEAAERANRFLRGEERAPKGLGTAVAECQREFQRLPDGCRAQVVIGEWSDPVSPPPARSRPLLIVTSLRCTVLRAGIDPPGVRLRSDMERRPFSVDVTAAQGRELGALLGREIDAALDLAYDDRGFITGGRLEHFVEVKAGDAIAAWTGWFSRNVIGVVGD